MPSSESVATSWRSDSISAPERNVTMLDRGPALGVTTSAPASSSARAVSSTSSAERRAIAAGPARWSVSIAAASPAAASVVPRPASFELLGALWELERIVGASGRVFEVLTPAAARRARGHERAHRRLEAVEQRGRRIEEPHAERGAQPLMPTDRDRVDRGGGDIEEKRPDVLDRIDDQEQAT